jgi:hypothetical protein
MEHLCFSYATATRGRRVVTKAQEKEGGEEGPLQETAKPFYATIQFWLQAAVVILTFGFVDAGYGVACVSMSPSKIEGLGFWNLKHWFLPWTCYSMEPYMLISI